MVDAIIYCKCNIVCDVVNSVEKSDQKGIFFAASMDNNSASNVSVGMKNVNVSFLYIYLGIDSLVDIVEQTVLFLEHALCHTLL